MPNKFASGKYAIAECDRCGQRYKLTELKKEVIKTKLFNIKVCPECWDPDHPQLSLGLYPVNDPQAVREPRPDTTYYSAGLNGLQITEQNGININATGTPTSGSRQIQWGWNPVGQGYDFNETPNNLASVTVIGTVTIN